ncbi:putative membrane protein [Escherichia coli 2846750]|nr:putative membrane protein [Escherichia coli 2872000]EMZ65968.1 putative membrane protein [Escherichia coli 2846750]ENA76825.1 putative membrane protein [Escherichia coli 2730450]ENB26295.1 putative membrane protein [Escherichia coli BCE030_MS-09]
MDSINKKNWFITHSCFQFLIIFNELPLFIFTEFMGDA